MARSKYSVRQDGTRYTSKRYDGKKKFFYGHTDKEIERKITEYEKSRERINIAEFSSVADAYWREKQKELAANTLHGYDVAVRRAKEEFGDKPVIDITPHDIYNFLSRFKAQGYSQKVINNTKSVLRQIFDYAFVMDKLETNPCNIPIVRGKAREPRQPASDADIATIEQYRNESYTSRLLYFILYTGARIGEASALQWSDIDLNRKTASVTKTLSYGNASAPSIKLSPKTEAGIRELQLPDNLIEALPPQGKPNEYVFFPNGLPRRRAFDTAIAKFKKEHFLQCTPHQLRHSYASMLHAAGIDVKDAQTLLGHSSIIMTQDIYTHLDRHRKNEVRESINEYIKKKTAPTEAEAVP